MSNWTQNNPNSTAKPAYDPSLHGFRKGVIDGAPLEGYPQNYWYADSLRSLVIGFGNFFNNVYVVRYDEKGEPIKKIQVPLKFGPRMKSHDFRVEQESGKKYYIQLPNMTYRIDSLQFASDRYAGAGECRSFYSKYFEVHGVDYLMANKFWADVQPVPYNVTISMEAKTEHISDANQIMEQILVRFAPENYIDLKEFWFLNTRRSIKIKCDSSNLEITTDFGEEDKREITASFTFTLEAFLYKPIKNAQIIDKIVTICGVPDNAETYHQTIMGNYSKTEPFIDRYDLSYEFGTKIGRASAIYDTFEDSVLGNFHKEYYYEELEDIVNYPVGSKQILSYSAFADNDKSIWTSVDQQLRALGAPATVQWYDDNTNTKAQYWSISGNSATFNPDDKTMNFDAVTATGKSAESARDTIWEISYDHSYLINGGELTKTYGGMIVKKYKNLFGYGDWNMDYGYVRGTKDVQLSNENVSAAPFVASSTVITNV